METTTQVKSNNLSERVGNKVRSMGATEKFPFFVKASDTKKNLQKSKKVKIFFQYSTLLPTHTSPQCIKHIQARRGTASQTLELCDKVV